MTCVVELVRLPCVEHGPSAIHDRKGCIHCHRPSSDPLPVAKKFPYPDRIEALRLELAERRVTVLAMFIAGMSRPEIAKKLLIAEYLVDNDLQIARRAGNLKSVADLRKARP